MRKILVPTDFSVPAENAAHYALELAKKLKADVLLCNAFKVPADAPTATQVAWPLIGYTELKQNATSDLDSLVKSLSDPSCSVDEDEYCPDLAYESGVGNVCELVSSLVKREKIDLVVMGMAGAGALTQFVLGSNCKEMIEKANVPLLLIPFNVAFKNIGKIAFTTDLNTQDLVALQFLINLALPLNAQITIVHITNKEVDPHGGIQRKIDAFLNKLISDIKFSSVKYEYVWNIDIDNGLDWIAGQENLDLIALTHHRRNLLARMFKGSHTQKFSRHTKIPLLVFPPKYLDAVAQ